MKTITKRQFNKLLAGVKHIIPIDSKKGVYYCIDYNDKPFQIKVK